MAIQLVPRTSLRLCASLRFSASELRFYSTQPTDHIASKDSATSDWNRRDRDSRTHRLEHRRQYMARRRADPEYRVQENQEKKERLARRIATDPEWTLAYRQNYTSRYHNPDTHEKSKELRREYSRSQRAEDPTYNLKGYTRYWLMRYKWVRDDLDWTPWKPFVYHEKVEHRCQECGTARHKGAKLWFG